MVQDRALGAARGFAFFENHQHVRKGHHDGVADPLGLAAERHPERGVRLDVAHHVVQVAHRHPGLVGGRDLRARRGSGASRQQ